MTFFELFLIGIGLSMDAFAVAICKGLAMPDKVHKRSALLISGTDATARLCTRQPLFRLYRAL